MSTDLAVSSARWMVAGGEEQHLAQHQTMVSSAQLHNTHYHINCSFRSARSGNAAHYTRQNICAMCNEFITYQVRNHIRCTSPTWKTALHLQRTTWNINLNILNIRRTTECNWHIRNVRTTLFHETKAPVRYQSSTSNRLALSFRYAQEIWTDTKVW